MTPIIILTALIILSPWIVRMIRRGLEARRRYRERVLELLESSRPKRGIDELIGDLEEAREKIRIENEIEELTKETPSQ